jgi:MFS family permease
VSGSFWLFLLSRIVSGAFSGNLSVATAAVADVTTRKERSRAMGIVGAAFGLGLVTGPVLGAACAQLNLLARHPSLGHYGINPYSVPALVSLGLCLVNLAWVNRSFKETLPEAARSAPRETRLRNPIRAIITLTNPDVRRANIVAFVYAMAFVAMEASITFLAAERFHYDAARNGIMLGFLGVCSIVTQGFIVRMLLKRADEIPVLAGGLISTCIGLVAIGLSSQPWMMYAGLGFVAMGSGLVNPSTTGLISLYAKEDEQGRVLGIFRSLGSLTRAFTPVLAGGVFFILGSRSVFIGAAALTVAALALSTRLAKPVH